MKKIFIIMLALVLILTGCSGNSSKANESPEPSVSEMIIGTWVTAERNGESVPTNRKFALEFVSDTEAYMTASFNSRPEIGPQWLDHMETEVSIDGNKVTLTTKLDGITSIGEYTVTSITDSEFTAEHKSTVIAGGKEYTAGDEVPVHFVRISDDLSEAILGTWEGHCTSNDSVFDDGEDHRWEYKSDGTYYYYTTDGTNWSVSSNTLNEYFVAGNLLCTRWIDNGEDNREWWEISIDGDRMNWTALRQNEDGSTFTATYEMTKVAE